MKAGPPLPAACTFIAVNVGCCPELAGQAQRPIPAGWNRGSETAQPEEERGRIKGERKRGK